MKLHMSKNIDAFLSEIEHLKESRELLESVFYEVGPYRDREVSDQLWEKVRNHFGFDDSE